MFLERIMQKKYKKLIITIDDKIIDENSRYDINREATKISALSSRKIDKHEYLTDEEILPPDQRRVINQAQFTYSHLGKAFEKKNKNDRRARKKIKFMKKKCYCKSKQKTK